MDLERINFLLTETDRHLVGIQTMIPLLREIKDELQQIRVQMFANHELHELSGKIDLLLNPESNSYKEEYSKLMEIIDEWPRAISPDLICQEDSEPDKEYRAESIIEFVITDYLKDMKFLDFGCGEGHVVSAAAAVGASVAVGYDLMNHGWDRWDQSDNFLFYESSGSGGIHQLNAHAPYDVILLYDMLDHMDTTNVSQEDVLKVLSTVLAPEGKIYVHCHPWCSRHGTHLYESGFNKAFAHLVLDEVELVRLGGYNNKGTSPITYPLTTYRGWFEKAGLKIVSEQVTTEKIEDFFFNQEIWKRISSKWNGDDPTEHLKISSVDYVLMSNTAQVF